MLHGKHFWLHLVSKAAGRVHAALANQDYSTEWHLDIAVGLIHYEKPRGAQLSAGRSNYAGAKWTRVAEEKLWSVWNHLNGEIVSFKFSVKDLSRNLHLYML